MNLKQEIEKKRIRKLGKFKKTKPLQFLNI
jgi:hypothetical protein